MENVHDQPTTPTADHSSLTQEFSLGYTARKHAIATLKHCHKKAQKASLLPSIDREMSLYEIAIMTRAGQAKALGLPNKGHLGVGADADVAIYEH